MQKDPIFVAPTRPAQVVMSDSLDIRLVVGGRLSPTALDVRYDRAELSTVLGRAMQPRLDGAADTTGRNAR
jgi:hypothetical protein